MNLDTPSNNNASAVEETATPSQGLWTSHEVADFLHVSLKTVFNLRKRGLPYVQLGGAVRFVPQEVRDYLTRSRGLSSHRMRQMIRHKGAKA